MNNVITVSGDRQAGKTHAVLSLAAATARLGSQVTYIGYDWSYVQHVHQQLVYGYLVDSAKTVHNRNGKEAIHLPNGGQINYGTAGQRSPKPTDAVGSTGTFIFDDALIPAGFAEANPNARIYVTETTGAAAAQEQRTAALVRAVREFVHGEESCPMPPAGRSKAHCVFADCPVHTGKAQ